ncbi:MAG: pilus assembly protein N-terminal domain-containing protein [Planctomycetota bacterium]
MRHFHANRQRSTRQRTTRLARRAALMMAILAGSATPCGLSYGQQATHANSYQPTAKASSGTVQQNPFVSRSQSTYRNSAQLTPLPISHPHIQGRNFGQQVSSQPRRTMQSTMNRAPANTPRMQTNPHFRRQLEPIVAVPASPIPRHMNQARREPLQILPVTDQRVVAAPIRQSEPIEWSLSDTSSPPPASPEINLSLPAQAPSSDQPQNLASTKGLSAADLVESSPVIEPSQDEIGEPSITNSGKPSAEVPLAQKGNSIEQSKKAVVRLKQAERNEQAKAKSVEPKPSPLISAESPVQLAPLVDFSKVSRDRIPQTPPAQKFDESVLIADDENVVELVPSKPTFSFSDEAIDSGAKASIAVVEPPQFDPIPAVPAKQELASGDEEKLAPPTDDGVVAGQTPQNSRPANSKPEKPAVSSAVVANPQPNDLVAKDDSPKPVTAAREKAVSVESPPIMFTLEDERGVAGPAPAISGVVEDPFKRDAVEHSVVKAAPETADVPERSLPWDDSLVQSLNDPGKIHVAPKGLPVDLPTPPSLVQQDAENWDRAPVVVAPVASGIPTAVREGGIVDAAPMLAGPEVVAKPVDSKRATFEVLPSLPQPVVPEGQEVGPPTSSVPSGGFTSADVASIGAAPNAARSVDESLGANRPSAAKSDERNPTEAKLASVERRGPSDLSRSMTEMAAANHVNSDGLGQNTDPSGRREAVVLNMERAQVKSMTIGGRLRRVSIANKDICQAFAAGANQLKLIGTGLGRTQLTVWADVAPGEPTRVQTFEIEVADAIDATGDRIAAHTALLNDSIGKAFPRASVVVSRESGQLLVTGQCDDERTAVQILRMVRKSCLVPVKDQLQVR